MNLPIIHDHGRSVPPESRNPRRFYEGEGREITPMTLQQAMDQGVMALRAICACRHVDEVPILLGGWSSKSFVPDAGMTLRCSACGTPDPRTEPAWPKRQAQAALDPAANSQIGGPQTQRAGGNRPDPIIGCELRVKEKIRRAGRFNRQRG